MANSSISVTAKSFDTPYTIIKAGERTILIDEPKFFGGEDFAVNPVEMFLASIAGCISAIGHWQANQMGKCLKQLDIEITGQIDSDAFFGKPTVVRSGFQRIEISLTVPNDWEKDEELIWLDAVEKRCPVLDNVIHRTEVYIKSE